VTATRCAVIIHDVVMLNARPDTSTAGAAIAYVTRALDPDA
jgi:hypothetical protein